MNYFLLFLTALFIIFQKVCQDRYNARRDSGVFQRHDLLLRHVLFHGGQPQLGLVE